MRASWQHLDRWRIRTGHWASAPGDRFGAFQIGGLLVIASSGDLEVPWQHVSVSRRDRCPTWREMDRVKRLFWDDDEAVMQLHVPRTEHVNIHPRCLHLWRPLLVPIPLPPVVAV